jgi:hypothetical protein
MRKGTYYFVRNGWGNQRGTDIEEIKLTKEEFLEKKRNFSPEGAYFKKYIDALYYTQD